MRHIVYTDNLRHGMWEKIYNKHGIDLEILEYDMSVIVNQIWFKIRSTPVDLDSAKYWCYKRKLGMSIEDWINEFCNTFTETKCYNENRKR